MGSQAVTHDPVAVACSAAPGFLDWLAQAAGAVAVSTYQAGKVAMIGWDGRQVTLLMRQFDKPLGLTASGNRLALATRHDVTLFANAPLLAHDYLEEEPGRYDALYLPRATYHTGDLNTHDVAILGDEIWLTATRFSCLAKLSYDFSFMPVWKPPFVTDLVPEDRCHLNGVAVRDGRPRYVTALGTTDAAGAWREQKATGGVLIDIETDEIVLRRLVDAAFAPLARRAAVDAQLRSRRVAQRGSARAAAPRSCVVCRATCADCAFADPYALVGLSKIRERHIFGGLPVQQRCENLLCGVAVVDLRSGREAGFFEFTAGCEELYDVQFLPGVRRPMILNLRKTGGAAGHDQSRLLLLAAAQQRDSGTGAAGAGHRDQAKNRMRWSANSRANATCGRNLWNKSSFPNFGNPGRGMIPMSLLQKPRTRKAGSRWERLRSSLSFSSAQRSPGERKPRRLVIDPLEERQLLSVSLASLEDKLINQATSTSQSTVTARSLATDNNGDFVVVWSRLDAVLDPATGESIINPSTGKAMTDSNIYARYFTDDVQRITLPEGVDAPDPLHPNAYATFSLRFGGNEVQELAFSATTPSNGNIAEPIKGTFQLSFTFTPPGGTPTTVTTDPINFNETEFAATWASSTTAAVNASDTTLDLKSLAALTTTPSFTIVVGDEHMRVTAIPNGTDQFTVTRGVDGTTAAAHDAGSRVTLYSPALQIQDALNKVGRDNPAAAILADVTVTGIDSQHYKLTFGDSSQGAGMNRSSWSRTRTSPPASCPRRRSAWCRSPCRSTTSRFRTTHPEYTALAIQQRVNQLVQDYFISPVRNLRLNEGVDNLQPQPWELAGLTGYTMPADNGLPTARIATPTVSVVSVPTADDPDGLRTFNIEFTGDSGMMVQPLVVVPAGTVHNADKSLNMSPITPAMTLKEPSDEFRVNPEEPDNPYTTLPQKLNQTNPNVAMDTQGDFVITWQSEVPDAETVGSYSDIFARMFKPVGMVDPNDADLGVEHLANRHEPRRLRQQRSQRRLDPTDPNSPLIPVDPLIQGVRPVESPIPYSKTLTSDSLYWLSDDVYTFRVNQLTANPQADPSIAMDAKGDFVIAWTGAAQPISFFNGVYMRRFLRDGTPTTAVEQPLVNDDTENHSDTFVAMSPDGYALVLWSNGGGLDGTLYDPYGALLRQPHPPGTSRPGNRRLRRQRRPHAWLQRSVRYGLQRHGPIDGILLHRYEHRYCPPRQRRLRGFPSLPPDWPQDQYNGQVAMDADGDTTVVYQGFGPDASLDFNTGYLADGVTPDVNSVAAKLLQNLISQDADLIAQWPALAKLTVPFVVTPAAQNIPSSGDIDSRIESILIGAEKYHGFSTPQVARLRAILDTVAHYLRGEGNGIMYSQWDANPSVQFPIPPHVLASDNVVNSQRDGTNTRYLIAVDKSTTGGTLTLTLTNLAAQVASTIPVGLGDSGSQ